MSTIDWDYDTFYKWYFKNLDYFPTHSGMGEYTKASAPKRRT